MRKHGFLDNMGTELIVQRLTGLSVMDYNHIHPQYEIYFCPENIKQKSVINGIEYNYKFPCVIISKPYSIHSMSCMETPQSSNTLFERYVIYFSSKHDSSINSELFPEIMRDAKLGLLFELTEEQAKYLLNIFSMFDCNKVPSLTEKEGELLMSFFINRLFEFCKDDKITKVGSSEFYIQDVLRYISENFSSNLNVSDVAKHFSVSRSKLERDFRNSTGRTPHEFIEMCRINQAKILLSSKQSISVSEISSMCGFTSETYFFVFFQKHVGVSPSEYRKRKLDEIKLCINKSKIETIN